MSLTRYLPVGGSVVGYDGRPSPYRMTKQTRLPRFGPSLAGGDGSAAHDESVPVIVTNTPSGSGRRPDLALVLPGDLATKPAAAAVPVQPLSGPMRKPVSDRLQPMGAGLPVKRNDLVDSDLAVVRARGSSGGATRWLKSRGWIAWLKQRLRIGNPWS